MHPFAENIHRPATLGEMEAVGWIDDGAARDSGLGLSPLLRFVRTPSIVVHNFFDEGLDDLRV